MDDKISELDSEGVYLGMSLSEFGVRVSRAGLEAESSTQSKMEGDDDVVVGEEAMPRESLREAVEHLKGELVSGEPLSSEERKRLERVLGDVSGILDEESSEAESDENPFDDLREIAEGFEERNPKLALVLGRIMDSLSQLGI
jgi:hypothetical protein